MHDIEKLAIDKEIEFREALVEAFHKSRHGVAWSEARPVVPCTEEVYHGFSLVSPLCSLLLAPLCSSLLFGFPGYHLVEILCSPLELLANR